jgi:hypothetical protein
MPARSVKVALFFIRVRPLLGPLILPPLRLSRRRRYPPRPGVHWAPASCCDRVRRSNRSRTSSTPLHSSACELASLTLHGVQTPPRRGGHFLRLRSNPTHHRGCLRRPGAADRGPLPRSETRPDPRPMGAPVGSDYSYLSSFNSRPMMRRALSLVSGAPLASSTETVLFGGVALTSTR